MSTEAERPSSGLAGLPVPTRINLALALLALPGTELLLRSAGIDLRPVLDLALGWAIAAAVVGIAVGVEGRSLASLGFRSPAPIDLAYLVGTAVATLLVFALSDPLIRAAGLPVGEGAGALSADVGLVIALLGAVTTGVVEEVLYRGYPIERLLDGTDSALVAGVTTWGVFTLAHAVVWPLGNLVQIAGAAAVLTVVYLRRRTLVPVIGAHVLVWVFAVLGQFYG